MRAGEPQSSVSESNNSSSGEHGSLVRGRGGAQPFDGLESPYASATTNVGCTSNLGERVPSAARNAEGKVFGERLKAEATDSAEHVVPRHRRIAESENSGGALISRDPRVPALAISSHPWVGVAVGRIKRSRVQL